MRVLVVGIPNTKLLEFVFTKYVVRVREVDKDSCQMILLDGTKYHLNKPANEIVQLVQGKVDEELKLFLEAPAASEELQ